MFEVPPSLKELRVLLRILCDELLMYRVWPVRSDSSYTRGVYLIEAFTGELLGVLFPHPTAP